MLVTLCTRYNACYTVYTIQCSSNSICVMRPRYYPFYVVHVCILPSQLSSPDVRFDTSSLNVWLHADFQKTQSICNAFLWSCHLVSDLTGHLWMFYCTQISRKRKVFVMRSFEATTAPFTDCKLYPAATHRNVQIIKSDRFMPFGREKTLFYKDCSPSSVKTCLTTSLW